MPLKPRRVVVFDLDGTLVESVGDIHCAANTVRRHHQLDDLSRLEVGRLIGMPARELFHDFAGNLDPLVTEFRRILAEITGQYSVLFPCIPSVLESLQRRGWLLAVATNKPQDLALAVLSAFDIDGYFRVVRGADSAPPKPDPTMVRDIVSELDCAQGVMVGDTPMDVHAGKSAGLLTVAVVSGGHSRSELAAVKPDMLIDSLCELEQRLA